MSPLAGLNNLRWVLLLPRLRHGLNDCARFAGFPGENDLKLTPMRREPWVASAAPPPCPLSPRRPGAGGTKRGWGPFSRGLSPHRR
jgi:hypothetical protein